MKRGSSVAIHVTLQSNGNAQSPPLDGILEKPDLKRMRPTNHNPELHINNYSLLIFNFVYNRN